MDNSNGLWNIFILFLYRYTTPVCERDEENIPFNLKSSSTSTHLRTSFFFSFSAPFISSFSHLIPYSKDFIIVFLDIFYLHLITIRVILYTTCSHRQISNTVFFLSFFLCYQWIFFFF